MLASAIPSNFPIPFANNAGGSYTHTIPTASQIGITDGAASLYDGFPPLNFVDPAIGGVPFWGRDVNGILYEITNSQRWTQSGGCPRYDAALSTAIGGYPQGSLLQSADYSGYWISTADNNTTNPETGGAGWLPFAFVGATSLTMTNANVTLTLAQYSKSIIFITGTVTTPLNLIFPTNVAQWRIINNTTGSTITAKTAAGTGVLLPYGPSGICGDGTNIIGTTFNAIPYANATNAADAFTATYTVVSSVLVDGYALRADISGTTANTTTTPTFTPTLNGAAQTARVIVKKVANATVAVAVGDVSGICELSYDSSIPQWILINPANANNAGTTKVISGTRDLTAASGSVNYTGFGGTPKWVTIRGAIGVLVVGSMRSNGFSNGTDHISEFTGSGGGAGQLNTECVGAYVDLSNSQTATASFSADTVTLVWTKTGTPSGNFAFTIEAHF